MSRYTESLPPEDTVAARHALLTTRWLIVVSAALTLLLTPHNALLISVLLVLVSCYNIALGSLMRQLRLTILLVIDLVWILALLMLSGGLHSPYFFLLALPLLVGAHWFSTQMLVILSLVLIPGVLLVERYTTSFGEIPTTQRIIAAIVIIIIVARLASRLTSAQRSERHLAIAATQRAETERNRLLSLINSLADGVIATNHRGIITHYNSAALDTLNTNTSLVGHTIGQFVSFTNERGRAVDLLKLALKHAKAFHRHNLYITNNHGTRLQVDVTVSPISLGFGSKGAGFIFVIRDTTKERGLEEQRDEFISAASHELRASLALAEASISTALMPQAGAVGAAPRAMLEQAHQQVVFLGRAIGDLSTLARAEKELDQAELTVLDAPRLLAELEKTHAPLCQEKEVELRSIISDPLPPITTHSRHIREILDRLITNALQHTTKGAIILRAEVASTNPRDVLFSVSDTGSGIPSHIQKRLFQKIQHSDDTQGVGTGLGLYVAKKLSQRIGATMWLKSKLQRGSTFYLQIPSLRINDQK